MATFEMPWPPTVNTYWRANGNRRYLSKAAKEFRAQCEALAIKNGWPKFGPDTRLQVRIWACPPDNRKRDLDNLLKAPLDVMEHLAVYDDDGQIDKLSIVREEKEPGGSLAVEVREIDD